jgi:predicted ATPase/serine phosphatase RsbU (regulator of sigma subunit)
MGSILFPLERFHAEAVISRDRGLVLASGTRIDDNKRVWLKFVDGRSPGGSAAHADAVAELLGEAELVSALHGRSILRPFEVEQTACGPLLVFEPFLGITLRDPKLNRLHAEAELDVSGFFTLAAAVTEAVAELHRQRVIHKRLSPEAIFFDRSAGLACLAHLGRASRMHGKARELVDPAGIHQEVSGLAYLSPEQTGRLNWTVGFGCDLYALGIIFYDLLTGRLPFSASDPLEWIHCHLARTPVAPVEIDPKIPPALSAIVLRLLVKNPADRYLSASGLLADLRRAQQVHEESPPSENKSDGKAGCPFPLGEDDYSKQFQLPEKIYGRAPEFKQLTSCLDRARAGLAEMVVLSGPPGSGKSSLIYEWFGECYGASTNDAASSCLFTSGKYERFQRDQPYFGLRRALRGLCRTIDCESEASRADWKARLNKALGKIGSVMTDNFPELLPIMGEQPPVPELPANEARNRFNEAFRKLISAFADPANPLILFLDDMQWADSSSVGLIESLLAASDRGGLLLILSFRNQDPDDLAEMNRALTGLEGRGLNWTAITAAPLTTADVAAMLADTMGGDQRQYLALAQVVQEKTRGNPFFVRQFLLQLGEEETIYFEDGWRWDEAEIRQACVTDNVVAFVAERIGRLPAGWLRLLELCSCFGSSIRRDLLPRLLEISGEEITSALDGVLAAGALLLRAGEYVFVHDRVREAAQSLIPPGEVAGLHLAIARALLDQPETRIEQDLFDIVHHLGLAAPLIGDAGLQLQTRKLNLRAARRARAAAAYGPALEYARAAAPALDSCLWETEYDLCASAALVLSECLFFNQLQQEFEVLNSALLDRLRDARHIITLRRMMILALSASSRHQEAVESAGQALQYLDAPLPVDLPATFAALAEETAQIDALVALRGPDGIKTLCALPPLEDARIEAIIGILVSITPDTVMLGLGALYALAVARAVRMSIQHGSGVLFPVVLANYSVVVHQTTGDVSTAYTWATLAATVDRLHGGALHAPANFIPAWLVASRKLPVGTQIPVFDQACRAGLEQGDILFGCFSAAGATVFTAWSGVQLTEAVRIAEQNRAIIRGRVYSADFHCQLEKQFARALMGLTQGRTSLADQETSLDQLEAVRETRSAHQIGYYLVTRLRLAYLFGDYAEANQWHTELLPYQGGITGLLIQADHAFYHALTLLQLVASDDEVALQPVHRYLEQLRGWAEDCPQNFLAYRLIVEAELARIEGRASESCALLAQALAAADDAALVHHAALACELAVRVHLSTGDRVAARAYLQEALTRYRAWGAVSKVIDLTEGFRELLSAPSAVQNPYLESNFLPQTLDLLSLMKSAEAISGEIVMSRLVERMMHTLIENACAQWGALVLVESGNLIVKAIQHAEQSDPTQLLDLPLGITPQLSVSQHDSQADNLPRSLLQYVASTREPLVLSDARRDRDFGVDPVIQRTQARSVLCAPILHKGELSGLIYLENNLTSGAFTPDRLEVLRLLSSQIAVSLENARYHERTLEWERLQRDLDAARTIQLSLLPQKMPDSENYLVAVRSSACYEVGGDYVDVLPLSSGEWIMVIADVAGKGLASAMIASSFRSAFRAIARSGLPLEKLANRLGDLFWSDAFEAGSGFVTAAFLRLDLDANRLEVVNAGHNPILLLYPDGVQRLFRASAPPLGMLPDLVYKAEYLDFPPGTRLLAFTDGLTEVTCDEDEYGEQRLFSTFSRLPFDSGSSVLAAIWDELDAFSSERGQRDDMTALALCRLVPSVSQATPAAKVKVHSHSS